MTNNRVDNEELGLVEQDGWRSGRPMEDPDKVKPWGLVIAKPSEYLVHCRRGRLVESSSGQGSTCFKRPWDSVAIVPTSLQRLQFTADQVTREAVGVAVTGLAVYRIVDPLMAYRVLNFSYPERAQAKLRATLTEMLIGACRRLVANLSVDECMRKRKQALAGELLRELAPVVGGEGRPDDATDRGWGVVLDTLEIQEVRVQSEQVFAAMQAPYRATLSRAAREARAEAEQASALRELTAKEATERATVDADAAVRTRRAEASREEAERAAREALRAEEVKADQARAEIAAFELQAQAQKHRIELREQVWRADHVRRAAQVELTRDEGNTEAAVALAVAEASKLEAQAQAQILTAEKLPELAAAVGQRFGEVKLVQIGGDKAAFSAVGDAVSGLLEMVRRPAA